MSGPRVREHLASRELPGKIKVVLGLAGIIGVLGLVNLAATLFLSDGFSWNAVWVNAALTLSMATVFLGLLPRTRWGWWFSALIFGTLFGLFLTAVLLSLLGSGSALLGRGCGLVAYAAFTAVVGAPFWLLLRCRQRYFRIADNR